jgi:hypothetical protein
MQGKASHHGEGACFRDELRGSVSRGIPSTIHAAPTHPLKNERSSNTRMAEGVGLGWIVWLWSINQAQESERYRCHACRGVARVGHIDVTSTDVSFQERKPDRTCASAPRSISHRKSGSASSGRKSQWGKNFCDSASTVAISLLRRKAKSQVTIAASYPRRVGPGAGYGRLMRTYVHYISER